MDRPAGARPNFAARRLGVLLCVISGVIVGGWLAGQVATSFAGQPASAAEALAPGVSEGSGMRTGGAAVPDVHVASTGDTLWSIADAHRGAVERDRYVDALVELNGGTAIQAGQAVRLP